jgi:hypothetical protein
MIPNLLAGGGGDIDGLTIRGEKKKSSCGDTLKSRLIWDN